MTARGSMMYVTEQWPDAVAVTTNDSTANIFDALMVATAGTVVLVTPTGNTLTFASLTAGTIIPIPTSIVKATGTSAVLIGKPPTRL